jgi:hypothetical protein
LDYHHPIRGGVEADSFGSISAKRSLIEQKGIACYQTAKLQINVCPVPMPSSQQV